MLTKEEISALRNRKTAAIETKMKKVHERDYYKDGIDHYYQIRSKKNPEKVDMRRFLTVYDPPKSIVTENTRIDGVYKTAEYLKYVDFVSRPDVEKVEIYGFKKTQEFADKYMVDSQTLYYWRSKDAFKKRVVDTIQKQTTSLAANVARIWYNKLVKTPEKCNAADFKSFLNMAGVAVEKSEKTVNNTFTAIRFKTEEEAGAREIDGDDMDPVKIESPSEAIKTNVKFM